jgi:hypothetical protein
MLQSVALVRIVEGSSGQLYIIIVLGGREVTIFFGALVLREISRCSELQKSGIAPLATPSTRDRNKLSVHVMGVSRKRWLIVSPPTDVNWLRITPPVLPPF